MLVASDVDWLSGGRTSQGAESGEFRGVVLWDELTLVPAWTVRSPAGQSLAVRTLFDALSIDEISDFRQQALTELDTQQPRVGRIVQALLETAKNRSRQIGLLVQHLQQR